MKLLLTGATGFLGPSLIDALLACVEVQELVLLVRRPVEVGDPRVRVVTNLSDALAERVTGIVHAAGDTRFDAPLEEARAANVGLTIRLVDLAERMVNLDRFIFLSTAFVAGRRTGVIRERELTHGAGFVNAYEQSKYETEHMLNARRGRLPIAICRLSTVVGDSRTGDVRRPRALHYALRFLYNSLAPLLPGSPESPVDLIATDYAAAAVAHFSTAGFTPGGVFHVVAGRDALALTDLLDLTMAQFVRERPSWRRRAIERPALADLATFELFVRSLDELGDSPMRRAFAVIRYFAPQLALPKHFDDSGSVEELVGAGIARPRLTDFYPRVVAHLVRTNWATSEGTA